MAACDGILGLHPSPSLFASVVLKPAIGVGHFGSKVGVHDILGSAVRIVQAGHGCGLWGGTAGGPEQGCGDGENQISHVVNRVAN